MERIFEMEDNRFDALGTIKEILYYLAVAVIAFGWMFLMLLIISFVAVSVIRIRIPHMLVISGAFTVITLVVTAVLRARKKRKDREIQRMLRE